MHCKNCLAPLSTEDTYCKICGTPVLEKGNYPSNDEIIKAYNKESLQPERKQDIVQPAIPSVPSPLEKERREEVPNIPSPSAPLPQHEPILTMPVSDLRKPEQQETIPNEIVEKKTSLGISKKNFVLSLCIAIIASVFITILICIPLLSKEEKKTEEKGDKKLETQTVIENRVLFSNYSFMIPDGYHYKINGTQLIVEKKDTKEAMALQVGPGTYANLKSNLNPLKTSLTNAKWTVGKLYVDQIVKGRNYLTVEANLNTQKLMIAYTTADETQIFGIVYLNPSATTYPSETIEVFADIIDSALKANNPVTTRIADFTKNKLIFTAAELSKLEKTGATDTKGQATTTNNQTDTSTNKTNTTTVKNP